ncbi:UDP-N-acetylglucosamine 2-epimerase (hydrolyzing) [Candidatus Marinamargulisbacteria bacterium SCGC AG-410-N11]|nr:UDP-N-acetylglucosamine 2-epimerase (hydrolyzing) [Candidatus Marinamargulisbacteria bacterium SCGC AG-410-N11]
MNKKICVVTGTRAEFGILSRLISKINSDKSLDLQLIATGMHLSTEFGLTYKEIESHDLKIDKKIEILLSSDTSVGISKSMGLAQISFAEAFEELKPDIIVLLGDRFEIFSAASAAMISRIPIIHLHGGEATEGLIDEPIRHSITKMSHYHFTSTENYKKRVVQLGENPQRVFNVGSLGVDNIKHLSLLSKQQIEKELGFLFNKNNILITFHPVTLENNTAKNQFKNLLNSLSKLKSTQLIFTKSNADTNGRVINEMIDSFTSKNKNSYASFSLGQVNYFSCLQFIDGVIGNSSSGIIEVPSFKIGTINIGDRQKGRIQAKSVIQCIPTEKDIDTAIQKLYSKEFQKNLQSVSNPYEKPNTCDEIINLISKININSKNIIKKKFYNLK